MFIILPEHFYRPSRGKVRLPGSFKKVKKRDFSSNNVKLLKKEENPEVV